VNTDREKGIEIQKQIVREKKEEGGREREKKIVKIEERREIMKRDGKHRKEKRTDKLEI
jgi:hypothetical protein